MDFANRLRENQALVEERLTELMAGYPTYGRLREAMEYSLIGGGKRIRPVLTLEVCRIFDGDVQAALPFACAIEMVHTYSLIHDDLPCMDDDDLRRGKPTSHKVFGECTAVLAGDALLTAAFDVLASAPLPPERVVQGVTCLSRAAGPGGMVGGQVLDCEGEGLPQSYDQLLRTETLKTGCMIQAAAQLGAIAAGASEEEIRAVMQYAACLGLAFQIQDDLLDALSTQEELGKPIGSDRENKKTTFLTLLGVEESRGLVTSLTQRAVETLAPYPNREFLCVLAQKLAQRRN